VGALAVYERNTAYQSRTDGPSQWTAGPKIAHFDRVEWHVIPDESTKANALLTGEVDWWENPTADMVPLVRRDANCEAKVDDETGNMACLRLNQLWPPFDNPAIRRALLGAIDQSEYMTSVAGTDRELWTVPTGFFCPGLPMANTAGLEVFTGKRDYDAVKQAIAAAGYGGEKIVMLVPTDQSIVKQECDVCADMLKQIGMNVDYQAMDWGTVVQRRAMMDPPGKGGWNLFITGWSGLDQSNPVGHVFLRGNGKSAMFGWPDAPKIEALRQQWIDAPDQAAQQKLAIELQLQAFNDVPYVPLGQYFQATGYRKNITDRLNGFVKFWNVRRS
jgi:peptide/nickel transport system substrate-binding protein